MLDNELIEIQVGRYTLLTRRLDNWVQVEEDIKTHQLTAIWMGGPNRPGSHYVNLPVFIKPNMEIRIFWDLDRLEIYEPWPQYDCPGVYTMRTLFLKPYEQGIDN